MYLKNLSTARVLDSIKSRLDAYRGDDALTHDQWRRITSPRRMLLALNEADIQLCSDLKVETQVVIFLPENTSSIHLRSSDYQSNKHQEAIQKYIDSEPEADHSALLNTSMYKHVGTLRSQYIVGFKDYPVGNASPSVRYSIVSSTEFQRSNAGASYHDDRFGLTPTAWVDHNRGLIHLSRTQSAESFVSFNAYVLPEKVDFNKVDNNEEAVNEAYKVVTPSFAERALVMTTLRELLPETSPVYGAINNIQTQAFRDARLRVPTDNSVKKVESWL